MKNFIKLSIGILSLLLVLSCEKIINKDCEIYNYGEITIKNIGSYDMYVDVTYSDMNKNDIRILRPDSSTKYRMTQGVVFCYASIAHSTDTTSSYNNPHWSKISRDIPLCSEEYQEWTTIK